MRWWELVDLEERIGTVGLVLLIKHLAHHKRPKLETCDKPRRSRTTLTKEA